MSDKFFNIHFYGKLLLLPWVLVVTCLGCGSGTSYAATTPVVKAPINGLVAMGNEDFINNPAVLPSNDLADPIANPNVYTAAVIMVTWKQLQPSGPNHLDSSAIRTALQAISSYNSTHTKHMVAKLRVFAGANTPDWALNLDGPPIAITTDSGVIRNYPRFWTANYTAAWKNLQNMLAAIYDTEPRVAEVAVSGCSSITAEPFNLGDNTPPSVLLAAGYTDAQYEACLTSMGDQYSAWTNTPLDYTFNRFDEIDSGIRVFDPAFTIQVMQAWRTALGTARGVIASHALQPTIMYGSGIYPEFTVLGPPIEFQPIGPTVDWDSTVAVALSYQCSELEVWPTTQSGGRAVISLAQLQTYASEF